jgi:PhnB protein
MFKPEGYNSLSPYLIAEDAASLVDLLKKIFSAVELRRFNHDNGKIAHVELKIDDSVLMLSDSTAHFPPTTSILHVYVADVFKTFQLAIEHGCEPTETPTNKEGDPDTRGSFVDFAGNYWSVSTQTENIA